MNQSSTLVALRDQQLCAASTRPEGFRGTINVWQDTSRRGGRLKRHNKKSTLIEMFHETAFLFEGSFC